MTPGPWIVETWPTKYPDLFEYNVLAPRGWTNQDGTLQTCGVVSGLDSEDDARLIAAAPDILAALQQLRQAVLDCRLLDVKKRFSLCLADAAASKAIAKATGLA